MTRLPVVGNDDNTWGDILNDFLNQAHKTDGTLANNTVGTNQLQDTSITDAKLSASAAISKSKLAPGVQTSLSLSDTSVQQVNGKSPTSGAVTLAASDIGAIAGVKQASAPNSPGTDDLWYDKTNDVWKRWNGSAWISAGAGAYAPAKKTLGITLPGDTFDVTVLPAYQVLSGHNPSAMVCYVAWADPNADGSNLFPTWMLNNVYPSGVTPIISWLPWDFTGGATQASWTLDTITSGNHDSYINTWAAACKVWGRPLVIRLMHEMNGNWYPWGLNTPGQGNNAAKFIAAWRYIWNKFQAAGVTNVKWAWSPNRVYTTDSFTSPDFTPMYPGDQYVDQLGLDSYNWGTSGVGTNLWETADQIFTDGLTKLTAINSTKPIYIFETSSGETGGSKAAWIQDAFGTYFKNHPEVNGVFWFDEDKSSSGEIDYRVNTSPSALAAWIRYAVKDPYWGGLYSTESDSVALVSEALATEVSTRTVLTTAHRSPSDDETLSRYDATQGIVPSLSTVHFTWFTAKNSETKNHIYFPTDQSASGLTAAYVGLYSFDNTTLTRIAVSAEVHASFNGSFNPNISIPATPLVAGTTYVFAFVFVGGTAPTVYGCYPSWNQSLYYPETSGSVAGATLPASVLKSALTFDGAHRAEIIA